MTLKSDEVYLDGYLKNYVARVIELKKKDWDLVIIVDGKERAGKSKFAQTIGISIDSTLCLPRIVFTPEEFHESVVQANPGEVIILDEAMTAFFSRAAMSKTNISLVRMLAECGQRNLIIIIVLPSIFVLDSYLALHRASCLFHIYTDKKNQRGFFKFYDRRRKKQLYIKGKVGQEYKYAVPNFRGRFYNHTFPWEEEYKKKKSDSLIAAFEKGTKKSAVDEKDKILESVFLQLYKGNKKDTLKQMRDMGLRFASDKASKWGGENL